ncbi:hypothetical protein PsYK624_157310 [Phanerochaete sordida]|uniref:F-box domain-containing protein n=1 Tax=Phanerochaete sordida TaxID=48140 RepID=A0A9P3GPQ3_9APHY|nr:hypothetical protein PsYK624_157310 [Phanerochaete sordida]
MAGVGSTPTRRKTIYDLPQEMLDRVIGFIPDSESLKACALTHRAWTRASQEHLHAKRRYSWMDSKFEIEPTQYSNPDIAALVRTLELSSPPPPSENRGAWEVLARFTRATRLEVTYLDWVYCFQEERDYLSATFGHITHLSLTDCIWRCSEDFVYFLTAFPHVTGLRLKDCVVLPVDEYKVLDDYPRQTIDAFPAAALRKLNVEMSFPLVQFTEFNPLEFIDAWVSRFPGVVPKELRFVWASTIGFGILPEYLRVMGPVLRELDIKHGGGSSDCDDFGLETCTSLRHLVVRGLCSPGWPGDVKPRSFTWVPRMLSQLRSSYLETVRLDIDVELLPELYALDFTKIDSILSGPHSGCIKHVTIAISPYMFRSAFDSQNLASEEFFSRGGTEFVTFIVDHMQGLRKLGKLRIVASGHPLSTIRLTPDGDIFPPASATPLHIGDFVSGW